MVTKSICKEEGKRLKKFEERTEEWASKMAASLKLTRDLCLRAAGGVCRDSNQMNELDRLMDEATETMYGSIAYAAKFATSKRSELMNEYQKKGAFGRNYKASPKIQVELQKKMERAFADVGMSIFEALQSQARELDRIATKSMQVIEKSSMRLAASKSEPMISSLDSGALSSSQELWIADSPADCQTSGSVKDCTIDWDMFESDLKAMSSTVGNSIHDVALSTSATDMICASHDSMAMMAQLKEAEQEKDEAIKRARQAEFNLHELERTHQNSLERFSTTLNDDDIMELRRALKLEQMTRVGLEVKLREAKAQARAAQDDCQAARFALTVAQQVAAKMASSGHRRNPSTDSLTRSPSAELLSQAVQATGAGSGIALRPSMSMGDIPEIGNDEPSNVVVAETIPETDGAQRSDSAFIVRSISLENTVSPTSTTTARVNEGEGESTYEGTIGSTASHGGMEILTSRGTREIFGEEPRETFATGSPDLVSGVPTEPFVLTPKTIETESRLSGSTRDRDDQMQTDDAWCGGDSPPKHDNAWNPFGCQGEAPELASPISSDKVNALKDQSQDNAIPSVQTSPTANEHTAAENEGADVWNPFLPKSPLNACSEEAEMKVSPQSKSGPEAESWNPFSAEETSAPSKLSSWDANNGIVPGECASKKQDTEVWNPFSTAAPEPPKKSPYGEWNPFVTDPSPAAADDKDAVWNPFV